MRRIALLGSTGSIGRQTLEVVERFPDRFTVTALAAGSNVPLLREQIARFGPELVSVADARDAEALRAALGIGGPRVVHGVEGAEEVATHPEADTVVSAMVGAAGLRPTLRAIEEGRTVALANKEVLVTAGELVTTEAARSGAAIIPVDSEHSALYQLISERDRDYIRRIILTASGGPLRNVPQDRMDEVSVDEALDHPTWKMGEKITIDSATLMNKGFEVIEARWLFGIPADRISIWIHPQSIVHAMVEYVDGSFAAQLSRPDMKIPIAYALSFPDRLPLETAPCAPGDLSGLTFEEPDLARFPSIGLCYEALDTGGTMPAVLNAANETAVRAFLARRIRFNQIVPVIEQVMALHTPSRATSLEEIEDADRWARRQAAAAIERLQPAQGPPLEGAR